VTADFRPQAIILFGSLARGDYYLDSDADVCVILRHPQAHWFDDAYRVSERDERGIAEVLVYGRDQFLEMLQEANTLALEVCHDGWVLEGDAQYIRQLEEIFTKVKHQFRLEKTPDGWRKVR